VTGGNFVKLVKMGFYDGLHFHRVIQSFMRVRLFRNSARREQFRSLDQLEVRARGRQRVRHGGVRIA